MKTNPAPNNKKRSRRLDDLSDVHDRYRRAVEHNRRLYNEVQDLKGSIRVFCRIRPPGLTGDASGPCVDYVEDEDCIAVHHPSK